MEISLRGSLKSFPLPEILTFLNLSQKTGTLIVSDELREAKVFFNEGAAVYASSNEEKFRLSAILYRKQKIDHDQWKQIENLMMERALKFGGIAVSKEVLTEQELEDYLKIQVLEIIYDCFKWSQGKFSFVDVLALPKDAVTISVDMTNLLIEGARRTDELDHIVRKLPDQEEVLHVSGDPEKFQLTLDEWKVLFLIDGKRTLQEICDHAAKDIPNCQRLLYGLYIQKLITTVVHPHEESKGKEADYHLMASSDEKYTYLEAQRIAPLNKEESS